MCRYFKKISNTNYISEWKSKRLSAKIVELPASFAPALIYIGNKTIAKFTGSCLNKIKSHLIIKQ